MTILIEAEKSFAQNLCKAMFSSKIKYSIFFSFKNFSVASLPTLVILLHQILFPSQCPKSRKANPGLALRCNGWNLQFPTPASHMDVRLLHSDPAFCRCVRKGTWRPRGLRPLNWCEKNKADLMAPVFCLILLCLLWPFVENQRLEDLSQVLSNSTFQINEINLKCEKKQIHRINLQVNRIFINCTVVYIENFMGNI